MTSFSELYFQSAGLAYANGVDDFEKVIPKTRFRELYDVTAKESPRDCEHDRFVRLVVDLAKNESVRPKCSAECGYRMKYDSLPLQRNALRVEIFTPSDRCGWNLKSGRIGGRPDDYHPCTFEAHA